MKVQLIYAVIVLVFASVVCGAKSFFKETKMTLLHWQAMAENMDQDMDGVVSGEEVQKSIREAAALGFLPRAYEQVEIEGELPVSDLAEEMTTKSKQVSLRDLISSKTFKSDRDYDVEEALMSMVNDARREECGFTAPSLSTADVSKCTQENTCAEILRDCSYGSKHGRGVQITKRGWSGVYKTVCAPCRFLAFFIASGFLLAVIGVWGFIIGLRGWFMALFVGLVKGYTVTFNGHSFNF